MVSLGCHTSNRTARSCEAKDGKLVRDSTIRSAPRQGNALQPGDAIMLMFPSMDWKERWRVHPTPTTTGRAVCHMHRRSDLPADRAGGSRAAGAPGLRGPRPARANLLRPDGV